MELPVVLSSPSHGQPGHIVDNLHSILPTWKAHLRSFYWGLIILGISQSAWLTSSLQPFLEVRLIRLIISFFGSWNWYVAAQSQHLKSHWQSVQWPESSICTKLLLSGRDVPGVQSSLPRIKGKAQTSLWVRLFLHDTRRKFRAGNDLRIFI